MAFLYNTLKKVYNKKVPSEGLAVFRIAYGIVLFLEVLQLLYFKSLIFDSIPYIKPVEINLTPALFAWLVALLCLILGLFTRYTTVVNLVLSLATFSGFRTFEYHLDWSLIGVNFLLPFLPLSKSWSLDNLIQKKVYNIEENQRSITSQLYYYLPVLLGIGLVYFDSIFWKLGSTMWINGLGFWLPSSLPQNTYLDLTPILNLKFLSISLGYVTLFFEFLFIFFIWNKKFRPILLIMGIGLHVGILIAYPIPLFALGIISIYLLLVPPIFWKKIISKAKELLSVSNDIQNVHYKYVNNFYSAKLHNKEKDLPKHNNYQYNLIYVFIIYCFLSQSLCLLNTPLTNIAFHKIELLNISQKTYSLFQPITTLNKVLLGITNHDVFLDVHFTNYNHIIAVTYLDKNGQEEWLPIITKSGQVSYFNTGKQWAKWTWRVNNPHINQQTLINGIERFTAFWAGKNNINLKDATFYIKVKKIDTANKWEKDFLRKQMAKPWINAGKVKWENQQFSASIPLIETL